jgi:hypothetical protein
MENILMQGAAPLHALPPTEASFQMLGPLVVALVGVLMLAGILRRMLFQTVTEGLACLDRRFITDPQPADAFHSKVGAKVVAMYQR